MLRVGSNLIRKVKWVESQVWASAVIMRIFTPRRTKSEWLISTRSFRSLIQALLGRKSPVIIWAKTLAWPRANLISFLETLMTRGLWFLSVQTSQVFQESRPSLCWIWTQSSPSVTSRRCLEKRDSSKMPSAGWRRLKWPTSRWTWRRFRRAKIYRTKWKDRWTQWALLRAPPTS